MGRWVGRVVQVVLVVLLLGVPVPAFAQGAPTVTLKASETHLTFGQSTTLSGQITPEAPDQPVHIIDDEGRRVASAETDAQGRYSVKLVEPRENMNLRAEWAGMISDSVPIRVRPVIELFPGAVRLFDDFGVRGKIFPSNVVGPVTVQLKRNGKRYRTHNARVKSSGWFRTDFRIDKPGKYRVVVQHNDEDHQGATRRTRKTTTPLPSLSSGSRSVFVKLLEKRLKQLHYKTPKPDHGYDNRTSDNVIAFNKVQGRARVGHVTESTWRALASPKVPKPKFSKPNYHIEVDQTKQVLYRVKDGKVISIMHVSTGAGSATRDGTFDFDSKLAGYSSKGLKYPSFFDGARAIHGWPSVPTYNASHGCVRVPMWQATWIFSKVEIGDRIHIYH